MKLAIIGTENLYITNIGAHIPAETSEIVLGDSSNICACAAEYAKENGIVLAEILPMYSVYGKKATATRNDFIAEYADEALIFWDGRSRRIKTVIDHFKSHSKSVRVIMCEER